MEKRVIDPEERKKVQGQTTKIVIGITAVIVVYVAYALVTKNLSTAIFEALLMLFVLSYIIMNDFVEPYRLGIFQGMTVGQKSGFLKIIVLDIVGVGAVLYWVISMGSEDTGSNSIFPLLIYILSAQMKRKFRPEFEGTEAEEEAEEQERTEDSSGGNVIEEEDDK